MKAVLLLALRASTGALLMVWGAVRAMAPERGVGLADKYYGGAVNSEAIQAIFGWSEIALGALVILGLFRAVVYPLQAVMLVGGAALIWKHILDPLSLYLFAGEAKANILFFPSTTVAVAALILLAFKSEDRLSLDRKLFRK